jgi:hypothetical protein
VDIVPPNEGLAFHSLMIVAYEADLFLQIFFRYFIIELCPLRKSALGNVSNEITDYTTIENYTSLITCCIASKFLNNIMI